jgi:hypothetical protein
MPFVAFLGGIVLITIGFRGTWRQFFVLLKGDLTGKGNFVVWFFALLAIGSIGYIPKLKPLSTSFMALVILRIALADGEAFFRNLTAVFGSGGVSPAATATDPNTSLFPTVNNSTTQVGSGANTPYGPNVQPFDIPPNGLVGFPPNLITPQIPPGA